MKLLTPTSALKTTVPVQSAKLSNDIGYSFFPSCPSTPFSLPSAEVSTVTLIFLKKEWSSNAYFLLLNSN